MKQKYHSRNLITNLGSLKQNINLLISLGCDSLMILDLIISVSYLWFI